MVIKVLSTKVKKLIRENPKAVQVLLNTKNNYGPGEVIRIPSDDGKSTLEFRRVVPKE